MDEIEIIVDEVVVEILTSDTVVEIVSTEEVTVEITTVGAQGSLANVDLYDPGDLAAIFNSA